MIMSVSSLTFYPVFLGTFLSVFGLSYLAWREHSPEKPLNVSQLGAKSGRLLLYFRIVLLVCGALFAVTMFGYVIPRVDHSSYQLAAWLMLYGGETLLAIVPARGKTNLVHNLFGNIMAVGMLATALLFVVNLHGAFSRVEIAITTGLVILIGLTVTDSKRFVFYELAYIYLSHISILVAAVALR